MESVADMRVRDFPTAAVCLLSPSRAVTLPNRHFLSTAPQTGLPAPESVKLPILHNYEHGIKVEALNQQGSRFPEHILVKLRFRPFPSEYQLEYCPQYQSLIIYCHQFKTSKGGVRMGWISWSPLLLVAALWIPPATPICYDQVKLIGHLIRACSIN